MDKTITKETMTCTNCAELIEFSVNMILEEHDIDYGEKENDFKKELIGHSVSCKCCGFDQWL